MAYPLQTSSRYQSVTLDAGDTVIDLGAGGDVPFPVIEAVDLVVMRVRADNRQLLQLNADYAVSQLGTLPGAQITLSQPAMQDDRIIAIGARPIRRPTALYDGQRFDEITLNAEFDHLTLQQQELRRDADRAWKADFGQVPGRIVLGGAGFVPVWDEDGNLVPSAIDSSVIDAAQEYAEQAAETLAETRLVRDDAYVARDQAEAAASAAATAAFTLLRADVRALLADTLLAYSGAGKTVVHVGDGLLTLREGFAYVVAAADAIGNDLVETAGGVRLRLLPLGGRYYVDGLGAAGDASISDQAAFNAATDDYAVLQRFFDLCGQTRTPGRLGPRRYRTNQKLLINYNYTSIDGAGSDNSTIIWGGGFDDVIATASGSVNTSLVLRGFGIYGGLFRAGTARYSFYAARWHRGCSLDDVVLREGLGIIKIAEGYYGTVDNLRLGPVVPNQTINGCTDAQWLEVNGADSAAVYLGDWNAGRIGKLNCSTLAGEARATGNLAAEQAMIVSGTAVDTGAWSIEATGVPYATYNARTQRLLKFTPNTLMDVELYIEQVRSSLHALFFDRHAKVKIRKLFKYACDGVTCLRASTGAQVEIEDYRCYVMNYDILQSYAGTGTTPAGLSWSPFRWGRGVWAPGQWRTDVALPGTDRNVFDTAGQAIGSGGTVRKLGPQDGNGSAKEQFFQNYRKVFPRKLTGLAVTAGSDGDGHYVQIAPGTMMAEDGGYRSLIVQSNGDPAILSYFRLRPTSASKWYRLWIGDAGNPYLVQHDTDPVATPEGDWIAQFETNGAGGVINLADNPRLNFRGIYKQSDVTGCEIVLPGGVPALGYWRAGTEAILAGAAAGAAPRARCVAAGTPGTWKNHANLSA